ncbi:MAG TPA: NADH-quinone oxidoreductase subunit N, partial [Parachlamydiaceae bacterium]|nr:NADH-quinone oxidoreductase subunit N [Parachlamydiaceae bacterium]
IGSSADFLPLFLGLETLSIALYVLCGYVKSWYISKEAAIKYFLLGSLGTAFFLYGVALIYGAVHTLNFDALLENYNALAKKPEKILFLSGVALVTLGLLFKAAIVPFHTWAPDVYEGSATPVTAFMATGTKIGAFAAFIRIFLEGLLHFNPVWNEAIALLFFPALIYANLVAIRQVNLRRFFAYSGISHSAFLLIPLSASSTSSISSILFYLLVYLFAVFLAFAVLVLLDKEKRGLYLDDLKGLFFTSPLLASFFALALLTLAGIPPTVGFLAKFYIFKAGWESGLYLLVIAALLTTVFSAFYYFRIVSKMLTKDEGANKDVLTAPLLTNSAFYTGLFFAFLIVFFSIIPNFLFDWIN